MTKFCVVRARALMALPALGGRNGQVLRACPRHILLQCVVDVGTQQQPSRVHLVCRLQRAVVKSWGDWLNSFARASEQYTVDEPDETFMKKLGNDVIMALVVFWCASGYFTSPDLRTAILNPEWSQLALDESILPCVDSEGYPDVNAASLEELNGLLKLGAMQQGLNPDKFPGHGGRCRLVTTAFNASVALTGHVSMETMEQLCVTGGWDMSRTTPTTYFRDDAQLTLATAQQLSVTSAQDAATMGVALRDATEEVHSNAVLALSQGGEESVLMSCMAPTLSSLLRPHIPTVIRQRAVVMVAAHLQALQAMYGGPMLQEALAQLSPSCRARVEWSTLDPQLPCRYMSKVQLGDLQTLPIPYYWSFKRLYLRSGQCLCCIPTI